MRKVWKILVTKIQEIHPKKLMRSFTHIRIRVQPDRIAFVIYLHNPPLGFCSYSILSFSLFTEETLTFSIQHHDCSDSRRAPRRPPRTTKDRCNISLSIYINISYRFFSVCRPNLNQFGAIMCFYMHNQLAACVILLYAYLIGGA